jgi:hypothetical protein
LKKRLGDKKGKWVAELTFVLWADRMMAKITTGQTPFSLVFKEEAMIPTKMVIPTARSKLLTPEANKEVLTQDLDTNNVLRDLARIRILAYQQRITKPYSKNIRI